MLAVRVDRIIEIEWAVQNHKPFIPSPKPARKSRAKKTRATGRERTAENETPMDLGQNVVQMADRRRAEFGHELTNFGSPGKRYLDGIVEEGESAETPSKRQKLAAKAVAIESGSDGEDVELVPRSPTKQGNRMSAQCS